MDPGHLIHVFSSWPPRKNGADRTSAGLHEEKSNAFSRGSIVAGKQWFQFDLIPRLTETLVPCRPKMPSPMTQPRSPSPCFPEDMAHVDGLPENHQDHEGHKPEGPWTDFLDGQLHQASIGFIYSQVPVMHTCQSIIPTIHIYMVDLPMKRRVSRHSTIKIPRH